MTYPNTAPPIAMAGRRNSRSMPTGLDLERDMLARPYLYTVPNSRFLFMRNVVHLLGITSAEVLKISHSALPRHRRADGELVFVAADLEQYIRGEGQRDALPVAEGSFPNRLLTVDEVADDLRVSAQQVRNLVRSGDLKFINVGRGLAKAHLRFEPQALEDFKDNRRKEECRSTDAPAKRRTRMTSNVEALDIQATLKELRSVKQKK